MVENAQFPIEIMQSAIQGFWQKYCEELQGSGNLKVKDLLIRSIMFGGARLIQTTYESMYQAMHLNAHAIYMIQLAQNILANPEEAVELLLGLS